MQHPLQVMQSLDADSAHSLHALHVRLQAKGWLPTINDHRVLCECHAAAGDSIGIWLNIEARVVPFYCITLQLFLQLAVHSHRFWLLCAMPQPACCLLQQTKRQGLTVHPAQLAALLKSYEPATTGQLPSFEVSSAYHIRHTICASKLVDVMQ